ncbi:uncharacterized protein LOC144097332 isoform X2 [Amblyomma americanum]
MQIVQAALLLLLAAGSRSFEEKDFICQTSGTTLPSASVCDGKVDCEGNTDESEEVCAPAVYLSQEMNLTVRSVTNTSVLLAWSTGITNAPNYTMEFSGYIVTGRSKYHSFQKKLSVLDVPHHKYLVQWLKPWTNYTFIVRALYAESGTHDVTQKPGRASALKIRTRASAPQMPGRVQELSTNQRDVVLSIEGPPAWNSQPDGFQLRWQAHRGLLNGGAGEMYIPVGTDWSPKENKINVTLQLQGYSFYDLFVTAVGMDDGGNKLVSPELTEEIYVTLESIEIWAEAVDPYKAVVAWYAVDPKGVFKLSVYLRWTEENVHFVRSYEFDGLGSAHRRHSALVTDLAPWQQYVVQIEQCGRGTCADAINATFMTPPDGPKLRLKHEVNINDGRGTSVIAWACIDCSVSYLQYMYSGGNRWINCGASTNCDFIGKHERTAVSTSGYMTLTHFRPH